MSIQLDDLILPDLTTDAQPVFPGAQRVLAQVARSLTGRPIIQETPVADRPLTLHGDELQGWIPRQDLDRLLAMAAVPGALYSLTLQGQSPRLVRFRHEDGPPVGARPVFQSSPPSPDDPFMNLHLNLMEVAA